jgi:hypothetical protein
MTRIPGQFVPLDVNYLRDRSIRRAGPDAELLYIRSLAHAKAGGTEGFIGDFDLEVVAVGLRNTPRRVSALVREELWVPVDDGWRIRSWEKWNATNEQVTAEKNAKRAAAIKTNHERWHVDSDRTDPRCPHCSESLERSMERVATPIAPLSQREKRERTDKERDRETTSEVAGATVRPDVEALLDLLDQRVTANGAKKPARTKRSRDAARLMLDVDGRTVEQVTTAIEWATSDEFWRAHILSMPKLRDKYDQLRLAASRQQRPTSRTRVEENLDVVREIAARDGLLPAQIGA